MFFYPPCLYLHVINMIHDQHVFTHGMYLPFLCPAQSLLWVYMVWVHSKCSLEVLLYFFQLFRCRNLALNRVFSYFFSGRHVFILEGVSGCPHICTPQYVHMPPYVCMPPGVYIPPICPHTLLCLCVFGGFACCGGL